MRRATLGLTVLVLLAGAGRVPAQLPPPPCPPTDYLALVRALAHDSMEGRAAGSVGAARAALLLSQQFRAAGLEEPRGAPAYLQGVPLRIAELHSLELVVIGPDGQPDVLQRGVEIAGYSERASARLTAQADLVFAGYGIEAPEAGWRDYAGLDVAGKLVVLLDGRPDSTRVRLTDDGPWGEERYKLDLARARGALGVIIVLPRGSRRFADVARLRERSGAGWAEGLGVVAWVTAEVADRVIFGSPDRTDAAGVDPRAARRLGIAPRANLALAQSVRGLQGSNVAGLLRVPGATETVLVSAHYDGLGMGEPDARGDSIYNGALDNASGAAALVCLARALAAERGSLRRNVLFLATTAEEIGHLGARWYVFRALAPVASTVVAINVDGINAIRPFEDVVAYGLHATSGEAALRARLAEVGVTISAFGFTRRMAFAFDTDEFGAAGIAGFTLGRGARFIGMSPAEGFALGREWNARYHRPDDEVTAAWDEAALAQHLALLRHVVAWYGAGAPALQLNGDAPYAALLAARRPVP